MTAFILATKSHLSFFGSRIAGIRYDVLSLTARFDARARERLSFVLACVIALMLCLYVVSVNVILGEGGQIGILERALRNEEVAFLNVETEFAVQSSAEQLKKYDIVRIMEDIGTVEYIRLGNPSLVEAFHSFP